ncbi:MAG: IS110 family transposase, partial [candidate division NC10 bacterium]|nr:IS110 family transposase [candidate division NC10 bacterium]
MPIIRSNAIRIKRFRELKETLRTSRDRLLVGIDIAKAQHVAQVRLAHTRILDKQLGIPNTWDGFAAFWAHLEARQRETGITELVCAVEPTGTYHEALAQFLEGHAVDVVLVSNHVAALNRRTLDGTWGKSDPKDAHNLCDLLERGHVLFYSRPAAPLAALRRLVRLLRHARTDLAARKARFRNMLLPALGPAGAPLPATLVAALPAPLQRLDPTPRRRCTRSTPLEAAGALEAGPVPPALAFELTDLATRLTAVQARIAQIEAELVRVAQPRPAYALLRSIPGVGPTVAAILLAEVGDITWYTKFSQLRKLAGLDIIGVATGQWTGTARISKCGRALLRWALYQAALGAARTPAWRARREGMLAKRRGDRFAFLKANIEVAAKLLRVVWGVWRSGRAYEPAQGAGGPAGRPAIASPAARAGRRGARPSGKEQAEIAQPRGRQTGRVSDRR